MIIRLKFLILKYKNRIKRYFLGNISSKIILGPNVQFFGLNNILIKDNCTIGEDSLFIVNNRTNKEIQLALGSNVYIGRDNFFSVGKSINIGDYCIFGNKCSLICSDHIFDNPLVPYALSGNSYNKEIVIGTNCWLGHDVSVVGKVKIGHGCVIGANTVVTNDIPPFSMVVGNPGRIIKTFNFETNAWEKGAKFNSSLYSDEDIYRNYLNSNFNDLPLGYYPSSSKMGDL